MKMYLLDSLSCPGFSKFLLKNNFDFSYRGKYISACEMPNIDAVSPENKALKPSYRYQVRMFCSYAEVCLLHCKFYT